MSNKNKSGLRVHGQALRLMRSASLFAISAAAFTGAAIAQDAVGEEEEEARQDTVIVTGIRGSLATAQDLKQNSDVFVDAITASDIGALPDRSVSEALQRVPGVNVLRFAGPNDPDHFAVEGSGVVIRGLPFVRSELNGRDVFGANNTGALGFEDVSPELLGSVQVFKNQSADLIEGGLAGTIDLRTRMPFDSGDRVLSFSVDATYSDFVEETTPSYSGLWSDQWDTSNGRFGLLASYSNNELKSRADATQLADFVPNFQNTDGSFTQLTTVDGSRGQQLSDGTNTFNLSDVSGDLFYIPRGGGIRTQEFDRQREAIGLAAQWESVDRKWLATAQFLQSDAELTWSENVFESSIDGGQAVQLQGSDFTFGGDRILTSGLLSENVGWRGNGNNLPLNGSQQLNLTRERAEDESTTDFGINLKWRPNDKWSFNFDGQYVEADTKIFDVTVHGTFFSAFQIAPGGDQPSFEFVAPVGVADDYFQNPANYYVRSTMDHYQDSDAEGVAFRADAEYDFDGDGFLKSVRFGGRFSDRETNLRETTFNWGNVSEIWTGSPNGLLTLDEASVSGLFTPYNFDNFQRGSSPINGVPFYSGPLASNYQGYLDTWRPILAGQGSFKVLNPDRAGLVPGTQFLPAEISSVSQETTAFYGRLDFGLENATNEWPVLTGNVGLRYVEVDRSAGGYLGSDSFSNVFLGGGTIDTACSSSQTSPPAVCSLSPDEIADLQTFFGDSTTASPVSDTFTDDYLLPSLNLKVEFGEGRLVRFGVSNALIYPQVNDLSVGGNVGYSGDIPDPVLGNVLGDLTVQVGNPQLDPIQATNIDLSYEWYFDETGSVTISAFWKDIEDRWIGERTNGGELRGVSATDVQTVSLTSNGVSRDFQLQTVTNDQNSYTLRGLEFAYQQFYDQLPAPFDGLGVQFNYTYIDTDEIQGVSDFSNSRFASEDAVFPRISEHQYNLVGLYEKGPIQGRLAWNWRDEFLLTQQDVIFPFASVYQEATGQLDASFFYDVTDQFKVGVQAVNLLDDVTETTMTVNAEGLRAPRAFNRNDRRFSFILRGNF